MDKQQKVRVAREAGHVERCHNTFHHGEYSDGLHSYHVVSLLLILHPSPRVELLKAALWHDMPERFLGDLPAPAKWYNPELNREYLAAEEEVLAHFGEPGLFEVLTVAEKQWLHACDRLELLLWCEDQLAAGNQHVKNIHGNVKAWFDSRIQNGLVPLEVASFLADYAWDRNIEDIRGATPGAHE